jgi:tRNA 2-thiouridine synthesizing protein E
MATRTYAGKTVDVDDEGFFTDPGQWTKEMAAEIAREDGIPALTEGHWKVIGFLQADYRAQGTMPTIRRVTKVSGVGTKELYELFPGGPLKKSSRAAGLPKPEGCI